MRTLVFLYEHGGESTTTYGDRQVRSHSSSNLGILLEWCTSHELKSETGTESRHQLSSGHCVQHFGVDLLPPGRFLVTQLASALA